MPWEQSFKNLSFFGPPYRTMTESHKLLKNMSFLDDPCSIQAYIKKRLSNSDLKTTINSTNLAIVPTTYAL